MVSSMEPPAVGGRSSRLNARPRASVHQQLALASADDRVEGRLDAGEADVVEPGEADEVRGQPRLG